MCDAARRAPPAALLAEVGPDAGRAVVTVERAGHRDGLHTVDELSRPLRAGIVSLDARRPGGLQRAVPH
ncbi:hypothetical protein [Streptomyces pseudovenezuelae]|uniref:Uncharacterized protein n=1 Tax=Streptomyces pseudovenezuelae TaxID=67350 RepID=A0ABZ1X5B0_9ACTN|nr:hypothetical protein [Streptomyces pseudovenezuelae]